MVVNKVVQGPKGTKAKPVSEPKCVKKKVPLLTNESSESSSSSPSFQLESADDDSSDVLLVSDDKDPLADSGTDAAKAGSKKPATLCSFSLDFDESNAAPAVNVRMTRKRSAQQSTASAKTEGSAGKKPKLKVIMQLLMVY